VRQIQKEHSDDRNLYNFSRTGNWRTKERPPDYVGDDNDHDQKITEGSKSIDRGDESQAKRSRFLENRFKHGHLLYRLLSTRVYFQLVSPFFVLFVSGFRYLTEISIRLASALRKAPKGGYEVGKPLSGAAGFAIEVFRL
jgi:hypothetical protein